MAFKFVILAAFVAMANAGLMHHAVETDYYHEPHYSYGYDVQDAKSGDSKSQHETRVGDAVQGSYSFLESDGTRRTVKYTADDHNGFNAVVHKEPAHVPHYHYQAAPAAHHEAAPATHYEAAPATHYEAAPATHYEAAPAAHHESAPAVHHAAPAHIEVSKHYSASSISHPSAPVVHYEAAPAYHH